MTGIASLLLSSLLSLLLPSSIRGITRNVRPIDGDDYYSRLLEGNWGRIFVREVKYCFEATNESHIVSTPCNKTDLRQIWMLNEDDQLVNFYHKMCLTPVSTDGRDTRVGLSQCNADDPNQKWSPNSSVLNDFTLQSTSLQQCLDVNGYAVQRTEKVQLSTCEGVFDSSGRSSDQYLQFSISYTQIAIQTSDAVISDGDMAKVSCLLLNTPKAPDYVVWSNDNVKIEEFSSVSGYRISTGIYNNNSMLTILTIDNPASRAELWTCTFLVDNLSFVGTATVDVPDVSCSGSVSKDSLTSAVECCYNGKFQPSSILWKERGYSTKQTQETYDIKSSAFYNSTQCTTLYLPRNSVWISFTVTFDTPYKTLVESFTVGPTESFPFKSTTSPQWRGSSRTSDGYKIVMEGNEVERNANQSGVVQSLGNSAGSRETSTIFLLLLLPLFLT